MPSGETRRKKSKSKKVASKHSDGEYHRAAGDEEDAFDSSNNHCAVDNDDVLPYPEAQLPESPQRIVENQELTTNGNSLPDISHRRKMSIKEKLTAQASVHCSYDRFLCFLLSFIFLFAVFIAGIQYEEKVEKQTIITDSVDHGQHNGPLAPINPKPEDYSQRQIDLVIKLRMLSGNVISVPNTPHHKAAHWMLWIDRSGISADSPFVWQRYILALFYYHMGDGNNIFELNENTDECNWERIGCDVEGHVQHIRFVNCDLFGSIPMEIQALSELAYLDLSHNRLTGEIPKDFQVLKKIQYLFMDNNHLEGVMPSSLCKLRKDGTLSQLTSDCDSDDRKVHCECCTNCANTLPDPIPPNDGEDTLTEYQKGVMQRLRNISGDAAIDDGESPQHHANHWVIKEDTMKVAVNAENLFQRYILAILWNMMNSMDEEKCFSLKPGVHECDWDSQQYSSDGGLQPSRISCDSQKRIQFLHLNGCKLRGQIPDELSYLSSIRTLDFSDNSLEGVIPSSLKMLDRLEFLYLDHNLLEGAVPNAICNMKDQNSLFSVTADCTNAKRDVSCTCCNNCAEMHNNLNNRQKAVMQKLRNLSGSASIDDGKSPQHRANHWMIKVDNMQLAADADNLYQRYVLVLLFYMMGDQEKISIDANSHECTWSPERIKCYNDNVTSIKFDNCAIQGPVPAEIRIFKELTRLDLSSNFMSGQIPSELADLHNLATLLLNDNLLEGELPNGLCVDLFPFKVTADCNRVDCPCCSNCPSSQLPLPPSPGSSVASTPTRNQQINAKCLELLGSEVNVKNSPQHFATQWMMSYDTDFLDATSPHFSQRLAVALLYYSLGPPKWVEPFRVSPLDECDLPGVECDGKIIVSLKLANQDLMGAIPAGIHLLSEVNHMDFKNNIISGDIPDSLSSMSKLEFLDLRDNLVKGSLPISMCSKASVAFHVNCDNVECDCCIECQFSELKQKLNAISYKDTTSKARLQAQNWIINLDSSKLQASSQDLSARYTLAVFYYSLNGDSWEKSEDNWLDTDHCQWTGVTCLPNREIVSLSMPDSDLSGTIPYELEQLGSLMLIDLHSNQITGKVPAELGGLNLLENLDLRDNILSGQIPSEICALVEEKVISVRVDCDDVQCSSSCCEGC